MIRYRVGNGCWENKFYKDEETGEDMIEDEVFRKRRFVPSKMDSLGFQKSGDQYCYETDFMNGEFHVILSVSKEGNVTSEVIDKMNNEEYVQLRSEHFNGAYVNTVRDAYGMKAAVLTHYDKNGTELEIREVSVPVPGNDEVLVKIKAAAVNPLDNMIVRGEVKLIVPYRMPLIMGNEFAGIVEKTGKNAAQFQPGDRVYGRMPLKKIGAFAEYAAVKESALAVIPEYLSFEEAATVPLTALTAMQAFEIMKAKAGESVFISGGTGSLGAMAIPVANSLGLHVYTNGSVENEERVIRLGAERFIDYKKENYVDVLANGDHVLDTLGERELPNEFKVLKKGESMKLFL